METSGIISDILNQHPLLVVFDILAITAGIGSAILLMRESVLFRGYGNLKVLAKSMAKALDGNIFRDGDDLVVSGFHRGIPAVMRFSFAENTPEVHLWLKIASALNLFVTHRSMKSTEGRMRIPTRDSWFDDRFVIRTDNPNDAVALLTDDRAFAELKKLCCSPKTALALSKESLEMSELTLPQPDPYGHLLAHLDSLAEIAVRVGAISNLKKAKTKIYVPDRYLLARAALVVLVLAGAIEVISAARNYGKSAAPEAGNNQPTNGLSDREQVNLPAISGWRLANPEDFDANTLAWVQSRGESVASRFIAQVNGPGKVPGTGYVLVNTDSSQTEGWRIAMLSQGQDLFDARFSGVLAVVPLKKDLIANAEWMDGAEATPDGDGWMVIRHVGDKDTASVYYLKAGRIESNVPADYTKMNLR